MYESPPPSLDRWIQPVRISTMSPGRISTPPQPSRRVRPRDLVAAGVGRLLASQRHRGARRADKRAHVLDPEHGRTAERGDGVGRTPLYSEPA